MSRFDMLGSWMQGSQLGQSQYAQLAGMAQNEALLRQRQAEEAARRQYQQQQAQYQQQQDAQRYSMEQARFGETQRMNTATLGRWDQQAAWENEDRAREEAIRQEEQQRIRFMRDWMKERARGAAGASMQGQRGMLPPEVTSAHGMMGDDATAFLPAQVTGALPADPPETQKLMRLIDNADGTGLKAMMPYIDSIEQQRKLTKMVEGIDTHIGQASMLSDPNHRAIYQAYRNANDPDGMMRAVNAAMQEAQKQAALQAKAQAEALAFQQDVADAQHLLPSLRNDPARAAAFVRGRDRGMFNQEDANISGRTADYKKSAEYELAKMDAEAALEKFRVGNSKEDADAYSAAIERLKDVIRRASSSGGVAEAPSTSAPVATMTPDENSMVIGGVQIPLKDAAALFEEAKRLFRERTGKAATRADAADVLKIRDELIAGQDPRP